MLSANIAVGGRALPILTKTYKESEYATRKTHKNFLMELKACLPEKACPIIITDAGFRNPWFRRITKLGWNFIGWVRHSTHYQDINRKTWEPIKSLYSRASSSPRYLFQTLLAKGNPLQCYFYLYKNIKEKSY